MAACRFYLGSAFFISFYNLGPLSADLAADLDELGLCRVWPSHLLAAPRNPATLSSFDVDELLGDFWRAMGESGRPHDLSLKSVP